MTNSYMYISTRQRDSSANSPNAEFIISTNASKFALGAVLLPKNLTSNFRPFAYFTKVLQTAHTNYPKYDQELLGAVCALIECAVTSKAAPR
jgi:hypothetical protein